MVWLKGALDKSCPANEKKLAGKKNFWVDYVLMFHAPIIMSSFFQVFLI